MLGNNADQFFTTAMRTSVRQGGNAAFATSGGMPAPWLPASATREAGFLPMGDDSPAQQIAADTKKFLGMTIPVAVAVGAAAFLFLTEPGSRIRAKLGF